MRANIIGKQRLPVEDMPELGVPPYGVDPYQYAVPEDYGSTDAIKEAMDHSQETINQLQKEAPAAVRSLGTTVDPKAEPNLPMSPAASGKTQNNDLDFSEAAELNVPVPPEQELTEKQLLRNYLQNLQVRRNKELELMDLNKEAINQSRLAMLAEGLSEAASKIGNLMGTPTGSTLGGFGKEVQSLEYGGIDQARKIMQGIDPSAELARQSQISSMMENIRASKEKSLAEQQKLELEGKRIELENKKIESAERIANAKAAAAAAAKKEAEQTKRKKSDVEFNQRYTNIQDNLQKMANMVRSKGTWQLTGTHNTDLSRLNYMIAIDFAKMFDPESVAREGEVKAAQKYLLPIQPSFEGGYTRTDTALKLIANMSKDIQQRAKNRQKEMDSAYGAVTQNTPSAGGGKKVYLKALTGESKVKAFTPEQAQKLLEQKQPNGQPMYIKVK